MMGVTDVIVMRKMMMLMTVLMMMTMMVTVVEAEDVDRAEGGLADVKEEQEECCAPRHVHLSLGEAADQVHVMWSTRSPCHAAKVTYGTSPWQLHFKVTGQSTNFTGPHSVPGLRHLHRATLMGLQEGKTYFYRPMCNRMGSGPFYFKAPFAHTEWSPQVLVSGEVGGGGQLLPLLSQGALSGRYSAILQLGGLPTFLSDHNDTTEDRTLQALQQTAAFLPLMTSPGDTDRGGDSQWTVYSHVFSMPGAPWPPPPLPLWYSFDLGPVHFISVCSALYVHGEQQQRERQQQWLRDDLLAANKARAHRPWIVVFTRHPLYCSPRQQDIHCAHSRAILSAGLEDLLFSQGVDLVLQSHTLGYQRFYPLYHGRALASNYTRPPAPVHLVLGTASPAPSPTPAPLEAWLGVNISSGGEGGGSSNSSSSDGDGEEEEGQGLVAVEMTNATDLTYGRLQVFNATHARWELVTGGAGREGEVVDTLWVIQDRHGPFRAPGSDSKPHAEDNAESGGPAPTPTLTPTHHLRPVEAVLTAVSSPRRLLVALCVAAGALLMAVMLIVCARRLRRQRSGRRRGVVGRRWDTVDYKYGQTRLSNDVDDDDDDEGEGGDFKDGSDEWEGLQTKRLITRH